MKPMKRNRPRFSESTMSNPNNLMIWWISSIVLVAAVFSLPLIQASEQTASGQQQQQQGVNVAPKVTPQSSAQTAPMSDSPNMNLIPVDQPVVGSASTDVIRIKSLVGPAMSRSAPTGEHQHLQEMGTRQADQSVVYHTTSGSEPATETVSFNSQADTATGPEIAMAAGSTADEMSASEPVSAGRNSGLSSGLRGFEGTVETAIEAHAKQRASNHHHQLQSQRQDPNQALDSSLMDNYQLSGSPNPNEHFLFSKYPQQQQQQQQQHQQIVERRFGLFKKQQHYGSPMSASYSASPYMTDCERCLASLNQQSADLQQLDPVPVPVPVPQPLPAPVAPIIPSSQPTFNMQPFGPLKNKLFMKFPFFMKPMSFGDGSYGSHNSGDSSAVPYWHQYQSQLPPVSRPQTSGALYIRPAQASYNCIQATPPLISSSNSHQDQVAQFGKTSSQSKQYPVQQQQQTTYSNSQY